MKHRGTKILAMLLTLAMVVGLMPGMGFTAYADVPQEGSNKYIGYRHNYDGFDVYGKRENADGTIEEIQTTYRNGGYTTVMEVGGSGSIHFTDFAYGKEYISNDVKASVTARVRGKGVLVTYTLFNDSDEPKTVKIGSYADTQIYTDDKAPCSFTENGIKMTTVDGTLEFQLIPGGGNFTTRWYGFWVEAGANVFNNRTDTSTFTDDSGIAWSWTIDIPARATITKMAELSAGQVGTTQIIYDANGGTGEMDPTVDIPGEPIKLNKNTFTKDDYVFHYVFQGWDTNSAGTTVVYADEATLTMPDTDTTLYAVWKANANAYTVTVADTPNGTVTADKTTAAAGETVTLTITPDNGYEVLAVAVSDANNDQIPVTNNSFIMPAADVTVIVQFKEKTTPQPAAGKYTVTYDANNGSGETKTYGPYDAGTTYTVEGCSFAAPEGKVFDCWKGSDGKTYKVGSPVVLNANLTLTAQWKDEEKPDDGEKKNGGSGGGFDLVFNIPGADNSWEYAPGYAPQQAYRVSLAPMQGGSAALGLTTGESTETAMNVYPTTTVYVFPNAEQGYVLDKIVWSLIDGSASYDITEAKNFVMPAMDVVVYVTFRPVG